MLTRHNDPVLWASGWRPVSASGSSTDTTEAAPWAPAAARKLHTQSIAVVVIPITSIDRIISVPVKISATVSTLHQGKRGSRRENAVGQSAILAASLIWFSLLIRLAVFCTSTNNCVDEETELIFNRRQTKTSITHWGASFEQLLVNFFSVGRETQGKVGVPRPLYEHAPEDAARTSSNT